MCQRESQTFSQARFTRLTRDWNSARLLQPSRQGERDPFRIVVHLLDSGHRQPLAKQHRRGQAERLLVVVVVELSIRATIRRDRSSRLGVYEGYQDGGADYADDRCSRKDTLHGESGFGSDGSARWLDGLVEYAGFVTRPGSVS